MRPHLLKVRKPEVIRVIHGSIPCWGPSDVCDMHYLMAIVVKSYDNHTFGLLVKLEKDVEKIINSLTKTT